MSYSTCIGAASRSYKGTCMCAHELSGLSEIYGHDSLISVNDFLLQGQTPSEIAGLARAMREKCVPVFAGNDVLDIVGTGGDGIGSVNISTGTELFCTFIWQTAHKKQSPEIPIISKLSVHPQACCIQWRDLQGLEFFRCMELYTGTWVLHVAYHFTLMKAITLILW